MSAKHVKLGARLHRVVRLRARPSLQSLEGRVAPANLLVTSSADLGAGTLRAAVATANSNGEADTISFDPAVTAVNLTSGQLTVTEVFDLTIDGGGTVTVNGGAASSPTNRLFDIAAAGKPAVTIRNITLARGHLSKGDGGAILTRGQALGLAKVNFVGNKAERSGGAIASAGPSEGGTVSITDCSFTDNSAAQSGGAISLHSAVATLTMSGTTLEGNGASYGGAMSLQAVASVTVAASTVSGNSAVSSQFSTQGGGVAINGGVVSFDDCVIANNVVGVTPRYTYANGAGLSVTDATVLLTKTAIRSNSVVVGFSGNSLGCGASFNQSNVTIISSVIDSNTITGAADRCYGGGIYAYGGSLELVNSSVVQNVIGSTGSSYGAGLAIDDTATKLTNCTIAENVIESGNYVYGGGVYVEGKAVAMVGCTIARNINNGDHWNHGGGIYLEQSGVVSLNSTILATNSAKVGADAYGKSAVGGSHNLLGIVASGFVVNGIGNLFGVNPGLLPLGDYGSTMPVVGYFPWSSALNNGGNPLALATDQRGMPREAPAGLPDVGAFELAVNAPHVASATAPAEVQTAGASPVVVSVTYAAPAGIDATSLDATDIVVLGPRAVSAIAFAGVTVIGSVIMAKYEVWAPGGSWDVYDSGDYTIQVRGDQILDLSSPPVAVTTLPVGRFRAMVPGTVTVDTTEDVADGDFNPGRFSLREAIEVTSAAPASADTIAFDPAVFVSQKTITLSRELVVSGSLTINGPGSNLLTIAGSGVSRLLVLGDYGSTASVALSGLSLANGRAAGDGGAVAAINTHLLFTDCDLSGSTAALDGGAVYLEGTSSTPGPSLRLVRTRVGGNAARRGGGVCVVASAPSIVISDSTIADNTASSSGGGVFAYGATLGMVASTVNGNTAMNGGGLFLDYVGKNSVIENSTISGNVATGSGGALMVSASFHGLNVRGTTVTANSATVSGGGVSVQGAVVASASSIIALNVSPVGSDIYFNVQAKMAASNCLIGVIEPANVQLIGAGNQTGTKTLPLDPRLGPLGANGGLTRTHALRPGSPAIDGGANPAGLLTDQRGQGFPRVVGVAADIGAFEAPVYPPRVSSVTVNDGAVQRSRVTSLRVLIDKPVTLPANPADAFTLRRQSDNVTVSLAALIVPGGLGTQVSLTFLGGAVEAGSLADGRYTLTVDASLVSGGDFDGNDDGVPGDSFVLVGGPGNGLFRLFGDGDGDSDLDALDARAFRGAVGGQTALSFDFDNDGDVDAMDFFAFRRRFGVTV